MCSPHLLQSILFLPIVCHLVHVTSQIRDWEILSQSKYQWLCDKLVFNINFFYSVTDFRLYHQYATASIYIVHADTKFKGIKRLCSMYEQPLSTSQKTCLSNKSIQAKHRLTGYAPVREHRCKSFINTALQDDWLTVLWNSLKI